MSINNAKPITRFQHFLGAIVNDPNAKTLKPMSRLENIIASAANNPYAENIEPISYNEYYMKEVANKIASGGGKNYKETIMTKADCIPKVLEYNLGAGLANGDYSVYVSIDTHLLPFGIDAIEGWLMGSPETLLLSILMLDGVDASIEDAAGYCVIWGGEWTSYAPDGTHVNPDAGVFEIGGGLMSGIVLPLNRETMAGLDMRVDIYHHPMPES